MSVNDAVFKDRVPWDTGNNRPQGDEADHMDPMDEMDLYCSICPDISDFFELTDAMVKEINHLREEVVRWRQVLIKYLPPDWADGLRQDIYDNVYCSFEDYDAYSKFINAYYSGMDPFDNEEHSALMKRLCDGSDETSITYI